jgi:hypothetical protein
MLVERKGEDGVVRVTRVLLPRLSIVPSEEMDPAAIAQISQGPNGEVRVRLHDKHAALVSIGKHLGMFTDVVQMRAVYGISEEPMSAEEWKRQYVRTDNVGRPDRWSCPGRSGRSCAVREALSPTPPRPRASWPVHPAT